jgi:hypothetical protein
VNLSREIGTLRVGDPFCPFLSEELILEYQARHLKRISISTTGSRRNGTSFTKLTLRGIRFRYVTNDHYARSNDVHCSDARQPRDISIYTTRTTFSSYPHDDENRRPNTCSGWLSGHTNHCPRIAHIHDYIHVSHCDRLAPRTSRESKRA